MVRTCGLTSSHLHQSALIFLPHPNHKPEPRHTLCARLLCCMLHDVSLTIHTSHFTPHHSRSLDLDSRLSWLLGKASLSKHYLSSSLNSAACNLCAWIMRYRV